MSTPLTDTALISRGKRQGAVVKTGARFYCAFQKKLLLDEPRTKLPLLITVHPASTICPYDFQEYSKPSALLTVSRRGI